MIKNNSIPFIGERKLHRLLIGFPLALVILMLVLGTIISIFAPIAQAASTTEPGRHSGWGILYDGRYITIRPHQQINAPNGIPGTIHCIGVSIWDQNYAPHQIKATMDLTNNCSNGLTNTYWNVYTVITCGPGQIPGPGGQGGPIIMTKGQSITVFEEEGTVTCLHDGIPVSWSATTNGSANGNISGTQNVGVGSGSTSINGF